MKNQPQVRVLSPYNESTQDLMSVASHPQAPQKQEEIKVADSI